MQYETSKMKFEYKYRIPNELIPRLRARIMPFMQPDPHMAGYEDTGYTVRSVYFDTIHLTYYYEKVEGLEVRKKVRVRGYNEPVDDPVVFLEIKRKFNNKLFKNRAALGFSNLENILCTGDVSQYLIPSGKRKMADDARKFMFHLASDNLKPTTKVMYERKALFGRFDRTLRMTFDMNIRSDTCISCDSLFEEHHCIPIDPGHSVFEVKFYSIFPSWLKPIIEEFNLSRQAYSKYTRGVDAAMRWSPPGCDRIPGRIRLHSNNGGHH